MPRDPDRSAPDAAEQDALAHALVGALLREDVARRPATAHPALESLIAYRTGVLDESARTLLQGHLGSCPDCARTLLDLEEFVAPAPGSAGAAADFEENAAWRRLQPALRAQLATAEDDDSNAAGSITDAEQNVAPKERSRRRWSAFATAAAVLAATTGALLVQTRSLERRLAQYEQPSADVSVLYVEAGEQRAAGSGPQHYEVPANAPSFLLMIESPDFPAQDCCEIEIASDAGKTVWQGAALPGDLGALRLSVPRAFLPAGVYWIVVSATSNGAPAPTPSRPPLVKEQIEIRYR